MAQVHQPPLGWSMNPEKPAVFLAGSIEMGAAEEWQSKVIAALDDLDIDIYNPRRVDWDSSWEQSIECQQFVDQVTWELNALEVATIVFMYLQPGTKSPVSLLELGLSAPDTDMVVCCPPGFWRKGNVDIVCQRYDVPVHVDLDEAIAELRALLYDDRPGINIE